MNQMNQTEEGQSEILLEFDIALAEDSRSIPNLQSIHPAVTFGIGGFLILNVGLLLSLPPVLMGRGAPYLPTVKNKMDQMFAPLKAHYASIKVPMSSSGIVDSRKLTFVDLGSGDGRVVFRAAREGLFHKSIGYEINPCKSRSILNVLLSEQPRSLMKGVVQVHCSLLSFTNSPLNTSTIITLMSLLIFCGFSSASVGELKTPHPSTTVLFNHQFLLKEPLGCGPYQSRRCCCLWFTPNNEGPWC